MSFSVYNIQNSVARIISNTSISTRINPERNYLLSIHQCIRQPQYINFFSLIFPRILNCILLVNLSFIHLLKIVSDSLAIALLLMLPLFGMVLLMRFVFPSIASFIKKLISYLHLNQGMPTLVSVSPMHSPLC